MNSPPIQDCSRKWLKWANSWTALAVTSSNRANSICLSTVCAGSIAASTTPLSTWDKHTPVAHVHQSFARSEKSGRRPTFRPETKRRALQHQKRHRSAPRLNWHETYMVLSSLFPQPRLPPADNFLQEYANKKAEISSLAKICNNEAFKKCRFGALGPFRICVFAGFPVKIKMPCARTKSGFQKWIVHAKSCYWSLHHCPLFLLSLHRPNFWIWSKPDREHLLPHFTG